MESTPQKTEATPQSHAAADGAKKLPELGKGIGEGIRGFKSAISGSDAPAAETQDGKQSG